MKLSCTQENLNKGLNTVSHIASKNTNLPILNNVLLRAEGGVLKLAATNLEIGISCVVRGKIEKEGSYTLPAQLFSSYISLLPNDRLGLELEDGKVKIELGNYKTKIKGTESSEFPLIPRIERENKYVIKAKELKKAISQTIFAVATDETRPEISGVLFDFTSGKRDELFLAATDSYRLAEKKVNIEKVSGKSENNRNIIVPARTLQELLRILNEEDEIIEIYYNDNQILFTTDSIEVISRIIEGQYPDYKQIIPKNYKTKITVDTQEFIKVVKTASLFSKSGINDISLRFFPDKKETIISAANTQFGENVTNLESTIEGEENNIVLNYRYFLDGLAVFDTDKLSFEIIDNSNPGILKPVKNEDFVYVVMPIKQ